MGCSTPHRAALFSELSAGAGKFLLLTSALQMSCLWTLSNMGKATSTQANNERFLMFITSLALSHQAVSHLFGHVDVSTSENQNLAQPTSSQATKPQNLH